MQSFYAKLVSNNCGPRIVKRSWSVTLGSNQNPALQQTYFLLQRRHHWLLWFASD